MVTTKEYLILSELAYMDITKSDWDNISENVSTINFKENFDKAIEGKVTGLTKEEWINIFGGHIEGTGDNQKVLIDAMSNWQVIGHKTDNQVPTATGFCGTAFKNTVTNEIVFSFRGTEPDMVADGTTLPQDLVTDFTLAVRGQVSGTVKQFKAAYDFVRDVMEKQYPGDTITTDEELASKVQASNATFTGHSLGGGLAQYMTYMTGAKATTFNAVGVGQALLNTSGQPLTDIELQNYAHLAVDYVNSDDIIGNYGKQLGTTVILKGTMPYERVDMSKINQCIQSISLLESAIDSVVSLGLSPIAVYTEKGMGLAAVAQLGIALANMNEETKNYLFNEQFNTSAHGLQKIINYLDGDEFDSIYKVDVSNVRTVCKELMTLSELVSDDIQDYKGFMQFITTNLGLEQLQDIAAIYSGAKFGTSGDDDNIDGDDTFLGFTGNDVIDGLAGNDYIHGKSGNDTIYGGQGYDYIYGDSGDDTLFGNENDDHIYGGEGNDTISGGLDNDYLYGESGNDTISGNVGNDYMNGGDGNDTYIFGIGDGQDTIVETDDPNWLGQINDIDTIRFREGIFSSDLGFVKSGYNLEILLKETTDKITINGYFLETTTNNYKIEKLVFASEPNVPIDLERIMNSNGLEIHGTDGSDSLVGDSTNNIFAGKKGRDNLQGQDGSDTYIFNLGDGKDTIYDWDADGGDIDIIRFGQGITKDSLRFNIEGTNLEILIKNTTDRIIIENYYGVDSINNNYKIEKIEFADKSSQSLGSLLQEKLSVIQGTAGVDNIYGSGASDTINGLGGNDHIEGGDGDDYIYGNAGNDTLIGGAGNDHLYGGFESDKDVFDEKVAGTANPINFGDDILIGGPGNDYLYGGFGNDTYIFNLGDGQDVIVDNDSATGNIDQLIFGPGITKENITFYKKGHDLIIKINGTNDSVTLDRYYDPTKGGYCDEVEYLVFANGDVLDEEYIKNNYTINIVGTEGDDKYVSSVLDNGLVGTAGKDAIYGLGGSDTINAGDGGDYVEGGDGEDTIFGEGGNDILKGGSDNDYIDGGAGDDYIDGGAGDEFIIGDVGNDTIKGGIGNDTLIGSGGNDKYMFSLGDGQDTIYEYGTQEDIDSIVFEEGITKENLTFVKNGYNLEIGIKGTTDIITIGYYYLSEYGISDSEIYKIEKLEFADGTQIDVETAKAEYDAIENDYLSADENQNIIYAGAGDDTITGGRSADTISGGAGNDYVYLSEGNDTYIFGRGDGYDIIYNSDYEGVDTDRIIFGEGVSIKDLHFGMSGYDNQNLEIKIVNSADVLNVYNWGYGEQSQIEEIHSSDGYVLTNDKVNQLIQAMASFTTSTGVSWSQAMAENNTQAQNILSQFWVQQAS